MNRWSQGLAILIAVAVAGCTAPPTARPAAESATPVIAERPPATIVPTLVPPTPTPPAEQRLRIAEEALETGDFSRAIDELGNASGGTTPTEQLNGLRYRTHLGYGGALLKQLNLDGSYAHYGEALKVRPADPAALEGQKQVVLTKNWGWMEAAWIGDPETAISALEEILRLDPAYRDGEAREKLYALLIPKAERLLSSKNRKSAAQTLVRALEIAPDRAEARLRLASVVLCEDKTPQRPAPDVGLFQQPTIGPESPPAPVRVGCGPAYIVGRSDEGQRLATMGQPAPPAAVWFLVRSVAEPSLEGWATATPEFNRAGAGDVTRQIPVVPVPALHPNGLPDLGFAATQAQRGVGSWCNPGFAVVNQWSVALRNNGPATGPRKVDLLIKTPGADDKRVTYNLVRGLEPNEEYSLGSVPDHSQVTLDPDGEFRETNKVNNVLRAGSTPYLVCTPR